VCFNTILLIIATLLSILPMLHIFALSLSSNLPILQGRVGLWPVGFDTFSYTYIIQNPVFISSAINSVIRVLMAVPINMVMIVIVAYPLSRSVLQFPARKFYVWFFLVTIVFSGGLVPLFMIIQQVGIFNTRWALVLPTAVPIFSAILMMNFFRELPNELSESAMMDGAGHVTIFLRIFLPLSKAALATVLLLSFVFHWNAWFDGLVFIRDRSLRPLPTYLHTTLVQPNLSEMDATEREIFLGFNLRAVRAANIFITTLPILLIYPFLQRHFTKGIRLGSVKG